jgi:UDP-N-acetylmuramoyl-tripeptide--D-alanyl-D-alanine ligase
MKKVVSKLKRFVVDGIVEPLLPLRRLESHVVFFGTLMRRIHKPFLIAVTGSVGKSTTTSMLAWVLTAPGTRFEGNVDCTRENMNDDLGVAATLLRYQEFLVLPWPYWQRLAMLFTLPLRALRVALSRYPKLFVLEFGVGATADFARLVRIAPPDIGVVTRIGPAHLEKLKNVEGVVKEKGKLVAAVPGGGLVVLGEHEHVGRLEQMTRARVIKVGGQGLELSRNVVRVVCKELKIPESVVADRLAQFELPERRLNHIVFPGLVVIDDTYNANPLSMRLGIDTLGATSKPGQRRVAILGYMGELGDDAPRYHQEIGRYARERVDLLIGVGDLAKHYSPDYWAGTSDSCADQIETIVAANDCVLVKGSFSSQMERVVARLCRIGERHARTSSVA